MMLVATRSLCVALLLGGAVLPIQAQSTDATSLRQRIEDQRTSTRRTAGERELSRSNSELEQRRRTLVRQRAGAIGSTRSIPILPKTHPSSVVVNQ